MKARNPEERFWEKVKKSSKGCWTWLGGKYYNGYGQFFDGKNKICAHRFAYKVTYGEFNSDLKVCHKCDNRECVNPEHLFLGTQEDNIHDMIDKGRKVNADTSGSKNPRAVIDEEIVLKMRKLYKPGVISYKKLGEMFGLSETQATRVVKGESWKKV